MIYSPKGVRAPSPRYIDRHKAVGQIDIQDGLVDITDPCYEQDTWCAKFGYHVKVGKYNCFIRIADFPYKVRYEATDMDVLSGKKKNGELATLHDSRIVALIIEHETLNGEPLEDDQWQLVTDEIGVDAGLCGFYNHKPDFKKEEVWMEFCGSLSELPDQRGRTCDIKPYGITVSSGFGDGGYPLYKHEVDGQVVALMVKFI